MQQPRRRDKSILAIQMVIRDAGPRRSGPGPFNILKGVSCAGRGLRFDSQESNGDWAGEVKNEWLASSYVTGSLMRLSGLYKTVSSKEGG
jgi:hypothetical protein